MLINAECISGISIQHPHPVQVLFNDSDLMLSSITIDLNDTTPGIEPFDPGLSLLPPELAFQVVAEGYIIVGTLAVSS